MAGSKGGLLAAILSGPIPKGKRKSRDMREDHDKDSDVGMGYPSDSDPDPDMDGDDDRYADTDSDHDYEDDMPSRSAYGSSEGDDSDGMEYGMDEDMDHPSDDHEGEEGDMGGVTSEQVRCARDAISALRSGDARGLAEAIMALVNEG